MPRLALSRTQHFLRASQPEEKPNNYNPAKQRDAPVPKAKVVLVVVVRSLFRRSLPSLSHRRLAPMQVTKPGGAPVTAPLLESYQYGQKNRYRYYETKGSERLSFCPKPERESRLRLTYEGAGGDLAMT